MQSKNFKACDELSEEISKLKSQRRESSSELAKLLQKTVQINSLFKKKAKSKEVSDMESSNPRSSSPRSTVTVSIESSNNKNSSDATLL